MGILHERQHCTTCTDAYTWAYLKNVHCKAKVRGALMLLDAVCACYFLPCGLECDEGLDEVRESLLLGT